jgi:hypothetical protein
VKRNKDKENTNLEQENVIFENERTGTLEEMVSTKEQLLISSNSTENRDNSTNRKDKVEVSNNIISIVKSKINSRVTKDNTSGTTESESEQERQVEHSRSHRQLKKVVTIGRRPVIDFSTSRNSNKNSNNSKVTLGISLKTNNIHMMRPNNRTKNTNTTDGKNHRVDTVKNFSRDNNHRLGDNTEGRDNKNINLRMTEEPEQMLEHNSITEVITVVEGSGQVDVKHKENYTNRQNREGKHKEKRSN